MNVSFNTVNLNNKKYNGKNTAPSFTAVAELPARSGFLKPINNGFDKLTDAIAEYYIKPAYESRLAHWLSTQEEIGQIVNHMQSIGSIVVSGVYVTQTLRSDMPEETKKKLSINQGLTWLAATLGAYGLDAALDKAWDKRVNLKYAAKFLSNNKQEKKAKYDELVSGLEELNKTKKAAHQADPKNHKRTLLSPFGKKFKPVSASKYVSDTIKNAKLANDLKGLDALKSLVIFGTIYRFISPVAVTPIANIIGDKLFAIKKHHNDQSENVVLERPLMAKFAGGFNKEN